MKKNNFLEGAFIATLAIFFTKFLGIIYVIPFYSIVGTQGGALYGYAYNIYNVFLIISSAGIPLAISKLTSEYNALHKEKEKEYMFYATKKIILIFSVVCFLICFIFAHPIASLIIGDVEGGNTAEDIAFVIRCVSFAILIVPLLSVNRGYLQGHSFIKPSSISQIIEQVVRVCVIVFGSLYVLKVLNLSLTTAVGVAVFGATAGALVAYIYLINKTKKIKPKDKEEDINLNKEQKKKIIKKIIYYAIPFIVINIANSLYSSTDMILLLRGLNFIDFNGEDIETISSVFTTWGTKLNTIVTSIASGFAVSLVPAISENRAKKDKKAINDIINKMLLVFLYIALPLAIFMSIFSKEIWTIFYGQSYYGPIIFKYLILTAALDALYIMMNNALQGLNKTKLIFTSVITGLVTNLLLDIPLILLFNKIGIYPYYGAITATLIGYTISLIIPIVVLRKEFKFDYKETTSKIPKIILVYIIMICLCLIYSGIINNITSRIYLILVLGIFIIVILILYLILNKKEFESILGKSYKDIIKRKKRSKE